ncbi:hypothetical protein AB0K34_14770 [Actinomadura sp. NPDC049382]|uniref:allene oxide cyclase barrel-like domain-containing protein n=1 Tax=Actinomadura sp. NPDC049382 TaxID=3158220 RepID=UPI0034348B97
MRPSVRKPGTIALTTLTALACVSAGSAAHAESKRWDCVNITGLTEVVTIVDRTDVAPPGPSLGDVSTFHDEFFDASGAKVGTADGTAKLIPVVLDNLQWVDSTDVYGDGTIRATGITSISQALEGKVLTLSAVGKSGRYAGKFGTRTFRLVEQRDGQNVYETNYRLCG